jgi:tetratricopeptide (TPR) repeat protein
MRGAAFQVRGLILALRCGERYRIARAATAEACFVSIGGTRAIRRTEALLQQAHALALDSQSPHAMGLAHSASGFCDFQFGRFKQALQHIEQATALLSEIPGAMWELDSLAFFSTACLVQLGEIGRVVRATPKAVREARQRGDLYAAVNLRIDLGNLAWLAVDGAQAALAQIDEAMSEWSKRSFHLEHYYELIARTNALLHGGRAREAYAWLTARWPLLRRSLLPLTIQTVRIYSLHARGRTALATAEERAPDRESLLRDAERAARRIERERMDYATPWGTLLRAGVAMERGKRELAVSLLQRAISSFDAADMALYATASRRRLGALLGGDEGEGLVLAADAWMTSQSIASPARMTAMLAPGFGQE